MANIYAPLGANSNVLTSQDLSWSGSQTFQGAGFTRAVFVDSVDGGSTYLLTATTPPHVRMETAGAAPRTVTIDFVSTAGDVGRQWMIHDAARDANTFNLSVEAVAPTTLNGVAGGSVSITVDGGAVILRVAGPDAWETIGI